MINDSNGNENTNINIYSKTKLAGVNNDGILTLKQLWWRQQWMKQILCSDDGNKKMVKLMANDHKTICYFMAYNNEHVN